MLISLDIIFNFRPGISEVISAGGCDSWEMSSIMFFKHNKMAAKYNKH